MGHPAFGSRATAGLGQAIIAMMPPHNVHVEALSRDGPGERLAILSGIMGIKAGDHEASG